MDQWQQQPGSLSTGQLMHLASQVSQHPSELLSRTAAERMWDLDPLTDGGSWASPAALKSSSEAKSSFVLGVRGGWLQGGPRSVHSKSSLPLRKRMVLSQGHCDSHEVQGVPRHDRGVSSFTKRENSNQEHAVVKLDASHIASSKKLKSSSALPDHPVQESPSSRKQSLDIIESEFHDEITAMESQIAEIGKSLQMNRFSKEEAEAKVLEEREAEKRRRELELRKARLKEKAAHDPHRKIQLRLENKKRFEMDTLDKAGIPTTHVTFQGYAGCEKMNLVDVVALRSKCQGLTEGIHSVSKLVELQQRTRKASRFNHQAMVPRGLANSSSVPSLRS